MPTAELHPPKPLHARWSVHLLFWCAYVVYRSVVHGYWQAPGDQMIIIGLDLPLKVGLTYWMIVYVAPNVMAASWWRAALWVLTGTIAAVLLRQGLWHGLILPKFFPEATNHPGYFDLADLLGNAPSLLPVAISLLLFWLVSELQLRQRNLDVEDAPARAPAVTSETPVALQVGARVEHLAPEHILYLRSDRDYCRVIATDREIRVRVALKAMLEKLPPNFVQTHRQYAVNVALVATHTAQQLKLGEHWIPIGRRYRKSVAEALSRMVQDQ